MCCISHSRTLFIEENRQTGNKVQLFMNDMQAYAGIHFPIDVLNFREKFVAALWNIK